MRKIGVAAILVGVCLFLFGTYYVTYERQTYSAYHVSATDEGTVDDALSTGDANRDEVVFEYESLSPNARTAFRAALEADGSAEFRDEKHRVSEFDHTSDAIGTGRGEYFVVYEGTYYRMAAWGPGPLAGYGAFIVGVSSMGAGSVLLLYGTALAERRVAISAVLGLNAAALVAIAVPYVERIAVARFDRFLAVGYLLCAVVTIAAWSQSDGSRPHSRDEPISRWTDCHRSEHRDDTGSSGPVRDARGADDRRIGQYRFVPATVAGARFPNRPGRRVVAAYPTMKPLASSSTSERERG